MHTVEYIQYSTYSTIQYNTIHTVHTLQYIHYIHTVQYSTIHTVQVTTDILFPLSIQGHGVCADISRYSEWAVLHTRCCPAHCWHGNHSSQQQDCRQVGLAPIITSIYICTRCDWSIVVAGVRPDCMVTNHPVMAGTVPEVWALSRCCPRSLGLVPVLSQKFGPCPGAVPEVWVLSRCCPRSLSLVLVLSQKFGPCPGAVPEGLVPVSVLSLALSRCCPRSLGLVPVLSQKFGPCPGAVPEVWALSRCCPRSLGLVPVLSQKFGSCLGAVPEVWALSWCCPRSLGLVPVLSQKFGPCPGAVPEVWALSRCRPRSLGLVPVLSQLKCNIYTDMSCDSASSHLVTAVASHMPSLVPSDNHKTTTIEDTLVEKIFNTSINKVKLCY